MSVEPSFSISDTTGTLKVWQGALEGEVPFEELKKSIPWKKHVVHGHFDRMTWRQEQGESRPSIIDRIEPSVLSVIGESKLSEQNFSNFYQDGDRHIFYHRDTNLNPGEKVTLLSLGSERKLTFVNYLTKQFYVLPLTDGTLVQFDAAWNVNHYHKVLKEQSTGARISFQWYRSRDEAEWKRPEHKALKKLWDQYGPASKEAKQSKREMLRLEPWSPDKMLSSGKLARDLIPEQLRASDKSDTLVRKRRRCAGSEKNVTSKRGRY